MNEEKPINFLERRSEIMNREHKDAYLKSGTLYGAVNRCIAFLEALPDEIKTYDDLEHSQQHEFNALLSDLQVYYFSLLNVCEGIEKGRKPDIMKKEFVDQYYGLVKQDWNSLGMHPEVLEFTSLIPMLTTLRSNVNMLHAYLGG